MRGRVMKKNNDFRHRQVKKILIMSCLLVFFSQLSAQDKRRRRLNLESLFPPTSYKNALETSMQVWSDIVEWREDGFVAGNEDDAADLIVGRLIRLRGYIEKLFKDHQTKTRIYSNDDLSYLSSVLDLTSAELESFTRQYSNIDTTSIENYLNAIKKTFNSF